MSAAQFCTASNPLANTSLAVPTTVPLSSVLASPRFRGKLPTPPAGSAELIDALLSISGELRVGVCALPPASDACAGAAADAARVVRRGGGGRARREHQGSLD